MYNINACEWASERAREKRTNEWVKIEAIEKHINTLTLTQQDRNWRVAKVKSNLFFVIIIAIRCVSNVKLLFVNGVCCMWMFVSAYMFAFCYTSPHRVIFCAVILFFFLYFQLFVVFSLHFIYIVLSFGAWRAIFCIFAIFTECCNITSQIVVYTVTFLVF